MVHKVLSGPYAGGGLGGSDEPPTLWKRSAGVHASAWRLATVAVQVGLISFSQTKHKIVRAREV